MASAAKTIIATGVSSGLGFETIKQLLEASQPYRIILGARNPPSAQKAFDALSYDRSAKSVTVLPLELNNLRNVRSFAQDILDKVGSDKIDYLLLNAGITNGSEKAGPYGSKWCEALIVNHLSHHYLMQNLREKLAASKSRIVFCSSGAVRNVDDVNAMEADVKGGAGAPGPKVYCQTKFIALLGAQYWRRQLLGQCDVVAVSPGLIPTTGINRGADLVSGMVGHPDAKTPAEGGASVRAAMFRDDLPEDPERMFLTSWGEWWEKGVYEKALDKDLQNKWCPEKEQLEKEEGLTS